MSKIKLSGEKAAKLVQHMAKQQGITIKAVCVEIPIHETNYQMWKKGRSNPNFESWYNIKSYAEARGFKV